MVEFSLIGKTILQKVFREYGKPFRSRSVEKIISVFNFHKLDDLYAQIGEGRIEPELGGKLTRLGPAEEFLNLVAPLAGVGLIPGAPMLRIKGGYSVSLLISRGAVIRFPRANVGIFTTGGRHRSL